MIPTVAALAEAAHSAADNIKILVALMAFGLVAAKKEGKPMRRQLERRWITLIFAGWLPHYIGASRGCLCLVSGI